MHLHDQPSWYPRTLQPGVNLDHGALDDVGGRALHGRVDGAAFGILAQRLVSRLYLRQVQASSEDRFHEAGLARLTARLFHISLYARIALEVEIHVLLRLPAADPQLPCQPK